MAAALAGNTYPNDASSDVCRRLFLRPAAVGISAGIHRMMHRLGKCCQRGPPPFQLPFARPLALANRQRNPMLDHPDEQGMHTAQLVILLEEQAHRRACLLVRSSSTLLL